jgi:Hemerythrin HHE cation binding domain
MSIVDKVAAAVTPAESVQQRQEARSRARAAASADDWLSLVLAHHVQIEQAFAAVEAARDASARLAAQKQLALILTGHSNAEESVIYPALARAHDQSHADEAYAEQASAKMEMSELESLPPMSQEYLNKLLEIQDAVAHHVYEEEGTWFLELKDRLAASDQIQLKQRYQEEFNRYVGNEAAWAGASHLPGVFPGAGTSTRRHTTS